MSGSESPHMPNVWWFCH